MREGESMEYTLWIFFFEWLNSRGLKEHLCFASRNRIRINRRRVYTGLCIRNKEIKFYNVHSIGPMKCKTSGKNGRTHVQ